MKTKEEILSENIIIASPFGTATVSNPNVKKAMINAMQEYSDQQTKELREEIERLKESIKLKDVAYSDLGNKYSKLFKKWR